jgi:hypothetical protein
MEASYEEVCRALSETPVPDLEEVSVINFANFTYYTLHCKFLPGQHR